MLFDISDGDDSRLGETAEEVAVIGKAEEKEKKRSEQNDLKSDTSKYH